MFGLDDMAVATLGSAVIGAGANMLGGGGSDEQQTAKVEPWEVMRPALRGLLSGAYDWYQSGVGDQQFPFSTVADFTPEQQYGMNLQAMRSMYGSPMGNQGSKLASSTIQGDFVNPASNPYLGAYFNQGANDLTNSYLNATVPQLQGTSQQAGMGNSTADALLHGQQMRQLGNSLQNLSTNIYGGAYNTERQNQNQMLNMIPQFAGMENQDISNLMNLGSAKQQQAQNVLGEAKNVWDTRQAQPFTRLSNYSGLLQPMAGLGSTQTSTTSGGGMNPLQSALQGGLAGASLYNYFGNPKTGTGTNTPVNFNMSSVNPTGNYFNALPSFQNNAGTNTNYFDWL